MDYLPPKPVAPLASTWNEWDSTDQLATWPSTSLCTGLPLWHFLPWLRGFKVGLSSCCCLTVTVPKYFTLGGCCGVEIIYFTLGGCAGPESKLLLLGSDGSLAFLETDATCLFILGALFGHRTFTSPSQVAVAWLIRILASSLVST